MEIGEAQWQACVDSLWKQAEAIAAARDQLQQAADALCEDLSSQDVRQLSLYKRELRGEREKEYSDMFRQLQGLIDQENYILELIERVEIRVITVQELLQFLPDEPTTPDSPRQQEPTSVSPAYGPVWWDDIEQRGMDAPLVTDPRRLTTGRNRRRLNAGAGVDTYSAEEEFYYVTADTHGGKSRRPGKNSSYYVGKGGRRIRKR